MTSSRLLLFPSFLETSSYHDSYLTLYLYISDYIEARTISDCCISIGLPETTSPPQTTLSNHTSWKKCIRRRRPCVCEERVFSLVAPIFLVALQAPFLPSGPLPLCPFVKILAIPATPLMMNNSASDASSPCTSMNILGAQEAGPHSLTTYLFL